MQFIKKYKTNILALLIITVFSLIVRIIYLNSIPLNITGDESWDISQVYRILYDTNVKPLTLLGDGSVASIVFYPVVILLKIFGLDNSILFLRFNIIIYSILALIGFYFLLKKYTSFYIALIFTLLLSANYVFLNFSRTAWVNMMSVFSGIFLILFTEKAIEEKKYLWFIFSGFFAGIGFYAYHYGRILAAFIILYLLIKLILNKFNKKIIKGLILFFITLFITILPLIIQLHSTGVESISRRPASTYAFSKENINNFNDSKTQLLLHQIKYSLRGFILLDGKISNEGVENTRYVPRNQSFVNPMIKILFILSLIYFIFKFKNSIWFFVILSVLITQILSVLPPNLSRGLFFLPIVYFIIAFFMFEFINIIKKWGINLKIIYITITIIFVGIIIWDINNYFQWMNTNYIKNARQPAIDYNEFLIWQDYQINLIKNGQLPITNYQWYEIREKN